MQITIKGTSVSELDAQAIFTAGIWLLPSCLSIQYLVGFSKCPRKYLWCLRLSRNSHHLYNKVVTDSMMTPSSEQCKSRLFSSKAIPSGGWPESQGLGKAQMISQRQRG